jgi:hypothetical protein
VEVQAHAVWNDTGLFLEAGSYRFAATGQWHGGSTWTGPGGTSAGMAQRSGDLRRFIGSTVGQAIMLYRRAFHEPHAHAPLAAREPHLPWLFLVGYVANAGEGLPGELDHERIEIGTGVDHEVKQAGYFYAFANDAWGFYGNNHGTVMLTVTRT